MGSFNLSGILGSQLYHVFFRYVITALFAFIPYFLIFTFVYYFLKLSRYFKFSKLIAVYFVWYYLFFELGSYLVIYYNLNRIIPRLALLLYNYFVVRHFLHLENKLFVFFWVLLTIIFMGWG